jgi:hypothetical protein
MKASAPQFILVFAAIFMLNVPARASTAISLVEYRQQLGDLSRQIEALGAHPENIGKTSVSIPDEVLVSTGAAETTVSYRDLKNDLAALGRANGEKRADGLRQIEDYLRTLLDEAESYDRSGDLNAALKKLSNILGRPEFHKTRGPSARDLLLARIYSWLNRMLSKLVSRGASAEWVSILVYGFIIIAMTLLAVWTIRRLRHRQVEPVGREIIPFAPSARSWRAWLAEARSMAQQQDWRNAIHLAYWAGISFLESAGAWKPNRARTPREYLRLMGKSKAEYPSLAALTRTFEVVWYGNRAASVSDFQETLVQLEKLGCR